MSRLRVIGGPADGLDLSSRAGMFFWIDGDGRRSVAPREGAGLYRRAPDSSYRFCGNHLRRCECGALVQRRAPGCPLCGRTV